MIDPTNIIPSALGGLVNDKVQEQLHKVLGDEEESVSSILSDVRDLLQKMLDVQSVQSNPDILEYVMLQANASGLIEDGQYYSVPAYPRNHMLIYVQGGGVIYYRVPGFPVANKSVSTAGWYQADLPSGTTIASNNSKPILIRWSDDAFGNSF